MSEPKAPPLTMTEALRQLKYPHIRAKTFQRHLADMTLPAWEPIRSEVAILEVVHEAQRLALAAAREEHEKLKADVLDWMLMAEGVKHDERCGNHFAGDKRWGICLRCQAEESRASEARLREALEQVRARVVHYGPSTDGDEVCSLCGARWPPRCHSQHRDDCPVKPLADWSQSVQPSRAAEER